MTVLNFAVAADHGTAPRLVIVMANGAVVSCDKLEVDNANARLRFWVGSGRRCNALAGS
jgi:hypothetical protein